MKNIILSIIFAIAACSSQAQNCNSAAFLQPGKKLVYTATDAKGRNVSKNEYTVLKKTANGATVESKQYDKKNKLSGSATVDMICTGKELKVDMRNLLLSLSGKQSGDLSSTVTASHLIYPVSLSAGSKLPDATVKAKIFGSGQEVGSVACTITNRKVLAKENISTAAGEFNSYKITYDADVETVTFGIPISLSFSVTEWYAPVVGNFVKSIADRKGKLISTTELSAISEK